MAGPLTRHIFGDRHGSTISTPLRGSAGENTMRALRLTTASRNYSRSLVVTTTHSGRQIASDRDIAHATLFSTSRWKSLLEQ